MLRAVLPKRNIDFTFFFKQSRLLIGYLGQQNVLARTSVLIQQPTATDRRAACNCGAEAAVQTRASPGETRGRVPRRRLEGLTIPGQNNRNRPPFVWASMVPMTVTVNSGHGAEEAGLGELHRGAFDKEN
ncbi:hypothetical protein EYF80_044495 [Liparis tanakae]|uniref:Uncharacterized protein n=1 Tax=Liparis tanakae TaxID=230148 RepID=A0A4Z2FWM6_9TELE|nr:hypothetical protein EYF80_044495 [Liparis tanakae]